MEESPYGLRVTISDSYGRAVELVTQALKPQGFGVLTEIDVKETLKKKLAREFRRYLILGACNQIAPLSAMGLVGGTQR